MAEQNDKEVTDVNDDFIPEDAWPVCPKCFKPCNPLQNYCDKCDSNDVINSLASYVPFVRIRFMAGFYGKMWQRIWAGKDTSIALKLVYWIVIIFGAPIIVIVGLPLQIIGKIKNPQAQKTATTALYILLFALLAAYLYFVS